MLPTSVTRMGYLATFDSPRQQRVMLNKIININHTVTKFATVIPYTFMIMCTNFRQKRTTFAEITLKNRMDPSSRTQARGRPHGGGGVNGQSYHYQICYPCSICLYAYVPKVWEENVHICRSYTAIRGTFIQHKNICLVIHVKSLDNIVPCLIKFVNINHTITKFATVVPYTFMIMCTNFDKKQTIYAEVTLKNRMDPSSQTRAWLPSVLNLRCLWVAVTKKIRTRERQKERRKQDTDKTNK